MWKILLVEDSPDIVGLVVSALGDEFEVSCAENLASARDNLARARYDLVLLDVMLPDGDGFELCSNLQRDERTDEIPVIFLTAKTASDDKVAAFALGAEDYVEKPFDRRELRARIAAKLRKLNSRKQRSEVLRRGDLQLNLAQQRAFLIGPEGEEELDLTPHEFKLLFQLARDENRPVSREELMEHVWGNIVVYERTIDSHLSNLRKKLGTRGHYVKSVRGVGYRFTASVA